MNIVNPSIDELMPKVDSKYTLVVLAAKRAREILNRSDAELSSASSKNVTNALEEIVENKITFQRIKYGIK